MGRRIRRRFLRWVIHRWPAELAMVLREEADLVERRKAPTILQMRRRGVDRV